MSVHHEVEPSTVVGSLPATGTVTLDLPAAPGTITVTLSTSNAAAAQPVDGSGNPISSLTIPAGSQTATFAIRTGVVAAATTVVLKATAGGVTKSVSLKVNPIGVASLTVSPNPAHGGDNATATITLQAPAGPAGTKVTLSTTSAILAKFVDSNGNTLASITVPAGSTTATVVVRTFAVASTKTVTLKATAGGITQSVVLTLTP